MSDVEENEIIINSELLNNDFDDLAFEPEIIKGDEDKESAIKYDYLKDALKDAKVKMVEGVEKKDEKIKKAVAEM